jgi:integrase
MSTVFLHPTRKTYYRRVQIPQKIRQHFKGKVEVWRSLKTADKDQAEVRAAQFDAQTRRLFLTLKKSGERLTKDQIETLVQHWLETEIDELEDSLALDGPVSDSQREGEWIVYSDLFDEASEALIERNYRKVEREADALLASAGLPGLDHDSAEFGRLCRRLLETKQEYLRIAADRVDGNYKTGPTRLKAGHVPAHVAGATAATATAAPTGPTFSEAVDLYFKENARAERTDSQVKAELERFVECIRGDKPIGSITKADCRGYKESLMHVRKLGPATVIKHLSNLGSVFKWSAAQGFIPAGEGSNPCQGLAPSKKQAKKVAKERRPFTESELVQVFGSRDFIRERDKNPARYWLPLLCLFTGARREEIGQLAVCDIQEEHGIPFIRINDDEKLEQSLKNEGSRRRVPVHSSLVKLGFLDYVKKIKEGKHVRLFPTLTRGANGWSDPIGKAFGRLVTRVGLTDPALCLHSLRHGTLTRLHSSGCPANIAQIIAGHSDGNVHGRYVHRELIDLKVLRDGLEKLRYDAVVDALIVKE